MTTAVVAVVAAGVGYRQLRVAREAREDQIRPFVVVDIVPSPVWGNFLDLVVENIGLTLARDVRFRFEPELETSQDRYDLADSLLIKQGIPSLPPRRQIRALFDVSHERKTAALPMTYDVTVEYSDAHGKPQPPLRYTIDLQFLFGLMHATEYGLHDAAKALREIDKKIGRWTGSGGRLNVWVRDEDERHRQELTELREEQERRRAATSEAELPDQV